jgi:hypothetical protein
VLSDAQVFEVVEVSALACCLHLLVPKRMDLTQMGWCETALKERVYAVNSRCDGRVMDCFAWDVRMISPE